jgi:hypothetical protein
MFVQIDAKKIKKSHWSSFQRNPAPMLTNTTVGTHPPLPRPVQNPTNHHTSISRAQNQNNHLPTYLGKSSHKLGALGFCYTEPHDLPRMYEVAAGSQPDSVCRARQGGGPWGPCICTYIFLYALDASFMRGVMASELEVTPWSFLAVNRQQLLVSAGDTYCMNMALRTEVCVEGLSFVRESLNGSS